MTVFPRRVMLCIKKKEKKRGYPVMLGHSKKHVGGFFGFFLHFGRFILTALAVVIANRRQCRCIMGARMEFKRGSGCVWVGLLGGDSPQKNLRSKGSEWSEWSELCCAIGPLVVLFFCPRVPLPTNKCVMWPVNCSFAEYTSFELLQILH